jgi:RHS repeat-associated protein
MVADYSNVIETRPKSVSYLTADALGSPRIITDQNGNVISRHDYMPFGEEVMAGTGGRLTTQGYAGNDGVKQKFTGYERDAESGLDYAQARYFASKHGRFTSVDPLTASANMKNPQTFNRYTYAMNSPYKFVDPLGLKPTQDCNLSGCPANTSQGTEFSVDENPFTVEPKIVYIDDGGLNPPEESNAEYSGDDVFTVDKWHWLAWRDWTRVTEKEIVPRGDRDVIVTKTVSGRTTVDFPAAVDELLYEFAQAEAKTAEQDEKLYARWKLGVDTTVEVSKDGPAFSKTAPGNTVFENDGHIEAKINSTINSDKTLSNEQKSILLDSVRNIINKTADIARWTGEHNFYAKNPRIAELRGQVLDYNIQRSAPRRLPRGTISHPDFKKEKIW